MKFTGLPHIIQVQHTTQTKNNIYIVTELGQKGSLADILKQHGKLIES